MIRNLQFLFLIKRVLLYFLVITIFLHFLKTSFVQYYYVLFFVVILSCLLIAYEIFFIKKKFIFRGNPIILYFLLSFIFVILISFAYKERWEQSSFDLLRSYGRLLIAPVMSILLYFLVQNKNDLKNILYLYVLLFLLAVFSIVLQNLIGHLLIFGEDIYGLAEDNLPRYGIIGYSSIIGSVNSYGVSYYTAVLIISLMSNIRPFIKAILISTIFIGAILTTSKASFLNILIVLSLMSIFYKRDNIKLVIIYILAIMLIAIVIFEPIKIATLSLYINTSGQEIVAGMKNEDYVNIFQRAFHRLIYDFDSELTPIAAYFNSFKDYIFGLGVFGGGSVFVKNNLATYHNSYLDIYMMGGIYFISAVIITFIFCIKRLNYYYVSENDKVALVLLTSNIIFFFNMCFYNGALFHPIISFPFWISVVYIYKKKYFN